VILDTNALSALADGDATLLPVLGRTADLALPVIVLGEYLFGIRKSRHRTRYEQWIEGVVLPNFQLLTVEEETASHYASLRQELQTVGLPIPSNDLWIGALARQHRLPVVSRDRHFDAVKGLRRVSW